MPDEIKQTPESSPGTAAPAEPQTPSFSERSSKWTSEQRATWELTGREPESPSPKKEVPSEPEKGKTAPESEPGKEIKEEPKRELSVDERSRRDRERSDRRQRDFYNRKIGEERARREAAERRLAEIEKKPPESAPGTPQPQAHAAPQGGPPELVLPDIADFESTTAYNAAVAKAVSKHAREAAQWEVEHREKARAAADAEAEAAEEFADVQESFHSRCADYRKTNPAFDQAFDAIAAKLKEAQRPYVDQAIVESEFGPAMVGYLHANPAEFDKVLSMSPNGATRHLGRLEEKFAKAPIPNKTTKAGDPPVRLAGKDEPVKGPKPGSREWIDQENAADARRILGA